MEQYQEALANLSQTIDQNPDDARTLAQRGETYRLMDCYQEALADFDRVIELKPDYAWAFAHRGEIHRLMGRYENALADFNCTLALRPEHVWALARRGVIYRLMGRYEEALVDFNRALELEPNYVWSIVHRGLTFIVMRRYEEALADFDQAFALDKIALSYWPGERGLVLNFLGQYPEAIASCEAALRQNPDDHIALYSLVVAKARWQGLVKTQAEIKETQAILQAKLQVMGNGKTRAGILYRLGGLAALQGKTDQALNYLQETIPVDHEPIEQARHDPAWFDLWTDPNFQGLIASSQS